MPSSAAADRACHFLDPLVCSEATSATARVFRVRYFTTQDTHFMFSLMSPIVIRSSSCSQVLRQMLCVFLCVCVCVCTCVCVCVCVCVCARAHAHACPCNNGAQQRWCTTLITALGLVYGVSSRTNRATPALKNKTTILYLSLDPHREITHYLSF